MKLYVVCTHYNRLIEAILLSTLNVHLLCRKSKHILLNNSYLLPDLAPWWNLSGSNYPCREQFSMVTKCPSQWSSTVIGKKNSDSYLPQVVRHPGSGCTEVHDDATIASFFSYSRVNKIVLNVILPSIKYLGLRERNQTSTCLVNCQISAVGCFCKILSIHKKIFYVTAFIDSLQQKGISKYRTQRDRGRMQDF